MSRGKRTVVRPLAVWAAASAVAGAAGSNVPVAWGEVRAASNGAEVADALVAACAIALALALAWLWVVATLTVGGLLAGTTGAGRGGATRRLVLAACGVAVVAGTCAPATAAGGDGRELLAGLALPERASAPSPRPRSPHSGPGRYVVRAGDSLWSIAAAHTADATTLDARWRGIWRANRDVVGADPDLILPGQALRLPGTDTDPQDGAR